MKRIFMCLALALSLFSCDKKDSTPTIDLNDPKTRQDFVQNFTLLIRSLESDAVTKAWQSAKEMGDKNQQAAALAEAGSKTPEYRAYAEHQAYMEKTYKLSALSEKQRKELNEKVAAILSSMKVPIFPKSRERNRKAESEIQRKTSAYAPSGAAGFQFASNWESDGEQYAFYQSTPCSDQYDANWTAYYGVLGSVAGTCLGMGVTPMAAVCWGAVAVMYLSADDQLNAAFCRCMVSYYGGCAY